MIDLEGAKEVYIIEKKVIRKGTVEHHCCRCEKPIEGRKVKIVASLVYWNCLADIAEYEAAVARGEARVLQKTKQFFFCEPCWRTQNETPPVPRRDGAYRHVLMRV